MEDLINGIMRLNLEDEQKMSIAPAQDANARSKSATWEFLHLPRELRDMIYDIALTARAPILIWGNTWPEDSCHSSTVPAAALIRTCRQIKHEAEDLLYKYNAFLIDLNFDLDPEYCNKDLHTPLANYKVMRNVVNKSTAHSPSTWDIDSYIESVVDVHLPIHKIRRLELRLSGPSVDTASCTSASNPAATWTVPVRRNKPMLGEYQKLQESVKRSLSKCISRCLALQEFRIVATGWNHYRNQFLLKRLVCENIRWLECRGRIVWVQISDDGDGLWLGDDMKNAIKRYLHGSVNKKHVTFCLEGSAVSKRPTKILTIV